MNGYIFAGWSWSVRSSADDVVRINTGNEKKVSYGETTLIGRANFAAMARQLEIEIVVDVAML